ncbi:MAG: hypothetical protein ACTSYD_00495 [Candidatus Heimdallarchaeaceae archaeon]
MKKREIIFSTLIVSIILSSVFLTDLAKGLTVSDQLELKAGSYVEGKVYYSNSTVTDEFAYNLHIGVEKIINATDVNMNLILFNYIITAETGDEALGLEDVGTLELDALVFEHNRTTLLPAARMYMANSTFGVEISVLEGNSVEYWTNFNNTRITFDNGTSYRYGDMSSGDFGYTEVSLYMFIYLIFNVALWTYQKWTLFAISPTANNGDKVHYYNADSDTDSLGTVIDKPQITDLEGKTHDAIHVKYDGGAMITGFDDYTVDAYYEAKTGLLIRSVETDGTETYEFSPSKVVIKTGLLPFPFVGVTVSLMAIGLLSLYLKKRRK